MTKEELTEIIERAYWQGFEDAGRLIIDTCTSKSKRQEIQANNLGDKND